MRQQKTPTVAAQKVLDAIIAMQSNGTIPTLGRIGKVVGTTKNPVAEAVSRLVKLGCLKRGRLRKGRPRALIVQE